MLPSLETEWDFRARANARLLPAWVLEREESLRINELTRKSVVFLGVLDVGGSFEPYGTGFIALWEQDNLFFTYLVTAKHVLDDMKASKRPLACRINAKNGNALVGRIEVEHWVTHPSNAKCDIAVASFLGSVDTFEIRGIDLLKNCLTESYITENDIGCGDGVFTAGLLVKHFGVAKNIPIVRIGNIAAMPEERIDLGNKLGQQEVYLIESRSIGGLSGSPVFLQTPPWRLINGQMVFTGGHQREYIIGVNIGLFETKAHGDKLATDTADRREHFLESMSAGIAVVVPIQRTIEIIRDSPFFQDNRRIFMKQRDENVDFVQTSAKPTIRVVGDDGALKIDPLGEENPTHLEDFSRLVDVAARKRPRDDQS
jgi:hypothetical protein